MHYKTTDIAGVKFTPRAMYNLDLQKWEREAARRLANIKAEFAKTGKILIINLRPRPVMGGQTTIWQNQ